MEGCTFIECYFLMLGAIAALIFGIVTWAFLMIKFGEWANDKFGWDDIQASLGFAVVTIILGLPFLMCIAGVES